MSKIQYEIIETVITERDDNVGVHAEMVNEWLSDYYEKVYSYRIIYSNNG